ncbi:MAG TPA: SpoIIE family protein phosphatase [Candidatus Acidoferrum sp.]|nr:SpoIIE family protein phosphatase [Candidatus Acidoferrum sp.]
MPQLSPRRLTVFLRRTTIVDRIALAFLVLYAIFRLAGLLGAHLPFTGLLFFLSFISVIYFFFRLMPWFRNQLLWRLRNRLIVAYLFIAVVPVVLLLTMVGLAAYGLYLQLGAHLLHDDLQNRISIITGDADAIAGAIQDAINRGAAAGDESVLARPEVAALIQSVQSQWPEIRVHPNHGQRLLAARNNREYTGLVEERGELWIASVQTRSTRSGPIFVFVGAPVTPGFLDKLASELGPVQMMLLEPADQTRRTGISIEIENRSYVPGLQILSRNRKLSQPANFLDIPVRGASTLEALHHDPERDAAPVPVLASFVVRLSALNRQLGTSVGAVGPILLGLLALAGVIFLVLETAALITGVVLTRTITRAVGDLYDATLRVRRGDFSHRVRVHQRDQLGALGESFNEMTASVSELIDEQRRRQRLENELSIAREVQEQLFPRSLPQLPGLQVAAICRPARSVSGDYYDFIRLAPSRLGIALADISGKGISAALLMASLQASLRSNAMLDGHTGTAKLVERLNQQLFKNTSDDRYATFFYAVYDCDAKTLTYTNAGHLAPFFVHAGKVQQLDEGGTVVGLFEEVPYTQGTLRVEPGSMLVAFSDGLTEPENVYGEEFGMQRLKEEVLRQTNAAPPRVAENLIAAAEQWAGSAEQADDITVVVARMD